MISPSSCSLQGKSPESWCPAIVHLVSHNPLLSLVSVFLSCCTPHTLFSKSKPGQWLLDEGNDEQGLSRATQGATEPRSSVPSPLPGALGYPLWAWAFWAACGDGRACAHPNPTRARPQPHRGPDVGLGLQKLLPQSLCQRSDGILGRTIEVDHRLVWNSVATHAG
jgi:hypothetical protein